MIFVEPIDYENEANQATIIFKMASDYQTTIALVDKSLENWLILRLSPFKSNLKATFFPLYPL